MRISKTDLTETEVRNVEGVMAYAEIWAVPGGDAGKGVEELYADAPEAISVLQELQVSFEGGVKEHWKRAEVEVEKMMKSRAVVLDTLYPSGDTVAVEARMVVDTYEDGEKTWPFAVFLTFDADGRIVRDGTYIPDWVLRKLHVQAAEAVKND